jgi:hypothetical protein
MAGTALITAMAATNPEIIRRIIFSPRDILVAGMGQGARFGSDRRGGSCGSLVKSCGEPPFCGAMITGGG